MEIYLATYISDELIEALGKLIPQLDESAQAPTIHTLSTIVNSESSRLFIVKHNNQIVASATLAIYEVPTGKKAWLEDVVVDAEYRRKGVGEKLVNYIVDYAKGEGLDRVDLTSNISRTAAHNLYDKVGFSKRKSNIFRRTIG